MYLDVVFRAQIDPMRYLGRRSLDRLAAFETGYMYSRTKETVVFAVEAPLREWILRLYNPHSAATKSVDQILNELAPAEDQAFNLFFRHLESTLAANPAILQNPVRIQQRTPEHQFPMSAFLDALAERPFAMLPKLTVGCLRAFLEGQQFAYAEEGRLKAADLSGFEYWIQQRLDRQGAICWERVLLEEFRGAEAEAFQFAMRELQAYRDSLGLQFAPKFEFIHIDPLARWGQRT